MRNGNDNGHTQTVLRIPGSYRTYEEWKLGTALRIFSAIGLPVLTVPMRNGNLKKGSSGCIDVFVLTVPMRNGN